MKLEKIKLGFTLVEVIVAVSLFATVGLLVLTVFVNITKIQGRLAMENAIYEDARFMMERISREIRNNAINFEEYFNKDLQENNTYGETFGCYAAQFYNPGLDIDNSSTPKSPPGSLGAFCNNGDPYIGQDCVVYKPSVDLNTGQYPYLGAPNPTLSNAFCPKYPTSLGAGGSALTCNPENLNSTDELYLINKDGTIATIFAKKKVTDDQYALGMLKLAGEDQNKDGVFETWKGCTGRDFCCADGFSCPFGVGGLTKLEDSLDFSKAGSGIYTGFVPISPLRSNIVSLEFIVTPGEDPRKAFAEFGSITQPMVRISLTVQPSKDQLAKFGNPSDENIPTIVLQNTISSRIQTEVKSYIGPDTQKLAKCKLSNS